jgi:hypothetical protein
MTQKDCDQQRHPDGKGVPVRGGLEEAERETRGPDAQERRRRPASRGEMAPHIEPRVRATQVYDAGPVEAVRSYLGRPRPPAGVRHAAPPDLPSATTAGAAEESAEVIVLVFEADGGGNPIVEASEAFVAGKDRTSSFRETYGSSRGWR